MKYYDASSTAYVPHERRRDELGSGLRHPVSLQVKILLGSRSGGF
jgi:hypothetical protein